MIHYTSPVDFSEDRMTEAAAHWSRIRRFVQSISSARDYISTKTSSGYERKWEERDFEFQLDIYDFSSQFRDALQDDFDTSTALQVIFSLVSQTQKYGRPAFEREEAETLPLSSLLLQANNVVIQSLQVFGIDAEPAKVPNMSSEKKVDNQSLATKLGTLRKEIRSELKKESVEKKNLFVALDTIRDDLVPCLGFTLKVLLS